MFVLCAMLMLKHRPPYNVHMSGCDGSHSCGLRVPALRPRAASSGWIGSSRLHSWRNEGVMSDGAELCLLLEAQGVAPSVVIYLCCVQTGLRAGTTSARCAHISIWRKQREVTEQSRVPRIILTHTWPRLFFFSRFTPLNHWSINGYWSDPD